MKTFITAFAATLLCSAATVYAEDMDINHMPAMVDHKLKMMDSNADGQVSRAEYDAASDAMFKNADANSDNMITRDELTAFMKKEKSADMTDDQIMAMVDSKMKAMDTNSDGNVTRAEFDSFHDKHFKNSDVNGDGQLSREELLDGWKKEKMSMHEAPTTDSITAPADTAHVIVVKPADDNAIRNQDGTLSSEGNMKTGVTRGATNDKDGMALPTTR